MSDRRDFLIKAGLGSLGLIGLNSLSMAFPAFPKRQKLVILHTNDMHSHIDPFPDTDPKYPGMGGMAQRASLIDKIRSENEHVLLLDAGDIFQGTPYFNFYHGEPEFKLMSMMKYDASTIGNHDFDNGEAGLAKMLPFAEFPFINSNYNFINSPLMDKITRYKIFEKAGMRIGVFGLGVELAGLVSKINYGEIQYNDPLEKAKEYAKLLRIEKQCDMVICLSHLGFKYEGEKISDSILARETEGIDLIIGGHTHTFLNQPEEVVNKAGGRTLINQVGWAGLKLGRIDFFVDSSGKENQYQSYAIPVSKNYAKV